MTVSHGGRLDADFLFWFIFSCWHIRIIYHCKHSVFGAIYVVSYSICSMPSVLKKKLQLGEKFEMDHQEFLNVH